MTLKDLEKISSFLKPYYLYGHNELWIKKNKVPSIYSGRLHPEAPKSFHPVLVTPSGRPLAVLDLSDNNWKATGISPRVLSQDTSYCHDKLHHGLDGVPVEAMELGAWMAEIEKELIWPEPHENAHEKCETLTNQNGRRL